MGGDYAQGQSPEGLVARGLALAVCWSQGRVTQAKSQLPGCVPTHTTISRNIAAVTPHLVVVNLVSDLQPLPVLDPTCN